MPEAFREHMRKMALPEFPETPFQSGPPLDQRRVALLTTAGLHLRGEPSFAPLAADYRVIPGDVAPGDVLMSHVSVNYDRSGWEQDANVVFPLERLRELCAAGEIGSVAGFHYSVMGATDPEQMEPAAREMAGLLARDGVNAVLLTPV